MCLLDQGLETQASVSGSLASKVAPDSYFGAACLLGKSIKVHVFVSRGAVYLRALVAGQESVLHPAHEFNHCRSAD